jgi:chorismate-pyruvate lyase
MIKIAEMMRMLDVIQSFFIYLLFCTRRYLVITAHVQVLLVEEAFLAQSSFRWVILSCVYPICSTR